MAGEQDRQAVRVAPFLDLAGRWAYHRCVSVQTGRLKIRHFPDPVLRAVCRPVAKIDAEVRSVARRMLELMRAAPGVGLAAPQVGLSWRLFVANHSGDPVDDRVFINPSLLNPSRETDEREEGCLSIPQVRGMIRRPTAITIQALDIDGAAVEMTADDLQARIWQHEYDHLDGVLIIRRMTPIDRMANRRLLKQLEVAFQRRKD